MNQTFACPYCGQLKNGGPASVFSPCRFCGFRSAFIANDGASLLIVDRKMPYLKRRCEELAAQMPGVSIIVDRRVAQDRFSHAERRFAPAEQPAFD